jgi:hypothetical protein
MKYAIYVALGGATLGAALMAWLAPGAIMWYFNPPVAGGLSCTEPIEWALKQLQWALLVGFGVGGVLGLVGYGIVQRRRVKQLEQHSNAPEGGSHEQVPKL